MIKILDNILTKEECLELISLAKDSFTPSTTLGEQIEGYRTAQNTWIYNQTVLTDKIKNIIVKETNLPIENQEEIHIVKYNVGEQYKNHHDFFHPGEDYYEKEIQKGGQRLYSCLFYLNDDFTGGETSFPNKNLTITPKLGRLVIWKNLKEDNSLDYDSLHAGLPVITNEKFICVIWVRKNIFNINNIIVNNDIKIKNKNKYKHFDLGKIIDDNECKILFKKILKSNDFSVETDNKYYSNSLGGVTPESWELLDKYLPLGEEKIGRRVKPVNPYIRIYKKGSILKKHIDRDGLDWTISLCLFSNIKNDWPLIVKNKNKKITHYPTKIGLASLVPGRVFEHWREPLECEDNELVVQIFLHYKECGC